MRTQPTIAGFVKGGKGPRGRNEGGPYDLKGQRDGFSPGGPRKECSPANALIFTQ